MPERSPAGTAEALTAAGAEVVQASFTSFETLPTDGLTTALAEAWDWVVVTSAQTVASLEDGGFGLSGRLGAAKVASVGPTTAAALARVGIRMDLVADPGGGTALAEVFPHGPGRVLLPGAEKVSAEPTRGLIAKGWEVRQVPVYRTVPTNLPAEVVTAWRAGSFDAFVVTAGSVARSAVLSCGTDGPKVVAIGAPAAAAARAAGLQVTAVATRPDAPSLVAATLSALT
nr:uroporphyrinogen-III synthase [Propionicimonas sp.]